MPARMSRSDGRRRRSPDVRRRRPTERRGPFRAGTPGHVARPPERPQGRPRLPAGRSCLAAVAVRWCALDVAATGSVLDGAAVARPADDRSPLSITGRHAALVRACTASGGASAPYVHAVGVAGAVVAGAVVGIVIGLGRAGQDGPAERHARARGRSRRSPACSCLHAVWWTIVRRWRSRGRLTPNIVIVGATRQAERIVGDALADRDVNVLGVFDDRLGRVAAATSSACPCSATSTRSLDPPHHARSST